MSPLKLIGSALFIGGVATLTWAIAGLVPGSTPTQLDGSYLTTLLVDIGALIVATFMVSTGMFFIIYGGEDVLPHRHKRDR